MLLNLIAAESASRRLNKMQLFLIIIAARRGGAQTQFPISKKLGIELAPRRGERQN